MKLFHKPKFIHKPKFLVRIQESERHQKVASFLNKYALLVHIPLSMLMIFALEWMSQHSFKAAVTFVVEHPGAFLYNSYIVFVCYTLVFLTKRRTFLRMVISAVFVMLGIVNCIILFNRVSPFGYTDLYMIGDLLTMQNTNYFSAQQGAIALAAILIYVLLMVRLFIKGKKQESGVPFWARLVLSVVCFATLPFVNKTLQKLDVVDSYFGNLAQGYRENGYIYSFSSSVFSLGMDRPDDYSAETIKRIQSETDMGKTQLCTEGTTLKDGEMPNFVVVLLESCYDVSETSFIETSEDPLPYFHYLEDNYSTGHLTVPVVGAGTCDSEFEVLTGMSMQFFGPGEYPQKTILKEVESCESIASALKKEGYTSHVVHNNGGNFYSRKNAFSLMGFDTFQSKEMLDITEYTPLGSWPLDDILVESTKLAMDSTDTPDCVYTITVGTHGDYPGYKVIDDPAIKVKCKGKDETKTYQWEYYINMLYNMDRFIEEFTTMLDERGEPTLVVMFGDHLPTLGLTKDEVATGDLYQTKYITWNNFGMKKVDKDLTTYQLSAEYLNRLGIHEGNMLQYNQSKTEAGIDATSSEYMDDLELLQYDLLYGKEYAYEDGNKFPAIDIEMGIDDVVIDKAYMFNGKLHIYGQNFTKWSKVYVNDEKVTTTYESGQVLTIDADSIEDGDKIVVNQVGSSSTIFRSSNEITFVNPNKEAEDEDVVTEDDSTQPTNEKNE